MTFSVDENSQVAYTKNPQYSTGDQLMVKFGPHAHIMLWMCYFKTFLKKHSHPCFCYVKVLLVEVDGNI